MHGNRLLLSQSQCLILQPEIVKKIGKSPAILIQQIHYWLTSNNENLGKIEDGKKYICNTLEQWQISIGTLSLSTIKRSIAILKRFNLIIIMKFNSKLGNQTNWYTINYPQLNSILDKKNDENMVQSFLLTVPSKVKMNQSLGQNEPIIIETETTNKDILNNPISSKSSLKECNPCENEETKESIPDKMLSIWIEETSPDVKPALTQTRAKLLGAAFKFKFHKDFKQWKVYCQQIASSDFLMGKTHHNFKATLDWILKFDTIQRIQERQFGVKESVDLEGIEEDVIQSLNAYSVAEQTLRQQLIDKLGVGAYKSWFKESQLVLTNKFLEITTRSNFCRDWIQNNFSYNLERIFMKEVVVQ